MRQYLAELLRAGLVLALVLFTLAGTAPEQQVGSSAAVAASIAATAASDFCGGGWGDHQGAHAPCHACRGSIPLLPSPPCVADPAFRTAVSVAWAAITRPERLATPAPRPLPRGPPALA